MRLSISALKKARGKFGRKKCDCVNKTNTHTHTDTHEKTSMNNLMPTVFPIFTTALYYTQRYYRV